MVVESELPVRFIVLFVLLSSIKISLNHSVFVAFLEDWVSLKEYPV